jgi:aminopeptidase N
MKIILKVAFTIFSFFGTTILAQVNRQITDSMLLNSENQIGVSNIDVQHSALDLRFDWEKKQAFGLATIKLKPLTEINKIYLDAGFLTINTIQLNNGMVLKFNYDGGDKSNGLEIILDKTYRPDESISIKIDYHTNYENKADPNNIWGSFGKGLRFLEPTTTTPKKRKQIWSSGQPNSNKYWYPCKEDIADVRTTEFTATVSNLFQVISNGELQYLNINKDGTKTFHYKAANPYPNYLTSIVVGEYSEIVNFSNNTKISTYCYTDEVEAAKATIERLPDMVTYFSKITNYPYPYKTYSQVVVQDYPFPGLNGQHTATIFSDNFIDDHRTHADFLYLWDGVESQSLVSQWFGNLITPKDWSNIWLNNSFCRYFDGLYNDYKNGHAEFLLYYLNPDLSTTIGDWNSGYKHPIVTTQFTDLKTFSSDNYTKIRGALVLRMLRKEVGESNWWKIIKDYVATNAGKLVTTDDLKKSVEKITGTSIEWFFDQWLYKMGHPIFEINKSYNPVSKELTLLIKQTQKIDAKESYPQNQFYRGKVEIEIDDKLETVELNPTQENRVVFKVNQEPKLVHFDYENTWIKEVKFDKSFDELIYQSLHDKDVLGKWNAVLELVNIAKDEKSSKETKEEVYSTLRTIISSNAYWRLRGITLFQLRTLLKSPYDSQTISLLKMLIKNEKSWLKTGAITFLGMTNDEQYVDVYINALNDDSDRVINAAAIALGKSKSPQAYDVLIKLADKPSWKSQSLISSLNGLKELKDPKGVDFALKAITNTTLPRWWLATPIWDYPIAAAETLVALNKADVAYPIILERFKKSMIDNDYNDIFSNVLLIATLADKRGKEVFDLLKEKFKTDENAKIAIEHYENQFNEAIKAK